MIQRTYEEAAIRRALKRSQVGALFGPRQSGKTTLARSIVSPDFGRYFDLEDPVTLARLEQPMVALSGLRGTVVIDEIQRARSCFPSCACSLTGSRCPRDSSCSGASRRRCSGSRRSRSPAESR